MPPPLGKFRTVLPLIVALVKLAAVEALPMPMSLIPSPLDVLTSVVLEMALF